MDSDRIIVAGIADPGREETGTGDAGLRKAVCRRARRRRGFTLLELIVAITILVLAMGVCFLTFHSATKAWQRGTALADELNHGDFVLDQLAMALRSAYTAPSTNAGAYGFWLTDDGDGDQARDKVSWVKIGPALVGRDSPLANAPHRIEVSIASRDNGDPGFAIKAWRPFAEPDGFDPERLEPQILSKDIVALNCRVATNATDDKLEWSSEWDDTNKLPMTVEITLYLKPLAHGESPVQMARAVTIPVVSGGQNAAGASPLVSAGPTPATPTPVVSGTPTPAAPIPATPIPGVPGAPNRGVTIPAIPRVPNR